MAKRAARRGGIPLDYPAARELLDTAFERIERSVVEGESAPSPPTVASQADFDLLFESDTQAYREGLLGCVLARIQDKRIDLTKPYIKHGDTAFNARTLDSVVVNPFLRDNRIPASTGPYLSAFRRGIQFVEETKRGLRDLKGYDAFLRVLTAIRGVDDDETLQHVVDYMLYRFYLLREASRIPLARIGRLSVEQYSLLARRLVGVPSGGRIPVFLVTAMFTAMNRAFGLGWSVESQGINVADAPSGATGDVTVRKDGAVVVAAEVTERIVDRDRIVATFANKIAEAGIREYFFFARPDDGSGAREQARQYFAQGHEIHFVDLLVWLHQQLLSIGPEGRSAFQDAMVELIDRGDTPTPIKVAWNEHVAAVASE